MCLDVLCTYNIILESRHTHTVQRYTRWDRHSATHRECDNMNILLSFFTLVSSSKRRQFLPLVSFLVIVATSWSHCQLKWTTCCWQKQISKGKYLLFGCLRLVHPTAVSDRILIELFVGKSSQIIMIQNRILIMGSHCTQY